MEQQVHLEMQGDIACIGIENPPVNAASHAVRLGLMKAIEAAESNAETRAVVLYGKGRTFVAGADIREFGKPLKAPGLPEVVSTIENCTKPVVVALHGTTLGGGLEIALGAHYRVAQNDARFGLPEVKLGLLPGAGGTQRLPRLVGIEAAAKIITSGEMIDAQTAQSLGLIDEIVEAEDIAAGGLAYARELLQRGADVRRTADIPAPTPTADTFSALRTQTEKSARGLIAPLKALDALEGVTQLAFEEGLAQERALFLELMESDQRAGMIHAFFAERSVAKLPEIDGITPREIAEIGLVGGGTMGAGIATAALLAGFKVILAEREVEAAERARTTVSQNLAGAVKRGKLSQPEFDHIVGETFRTTVDYADFSNSDLVIEAAFEDMGVKQDIFKKLDAVCKPGAILATNTSYLDINKIAETTTRPGDVIGLHFFSPAHIMKLLEVVVADKTSSDVVATGFALAKRMKKIAVRAGVCDGFIGNRILGAYQKALFSTVLAGASPYDIDKALEGFGLAMGPFAVSDLAGLDIGWANRKRLAPHRDPQERYAEFADRLCEMGRFGRKTGRGFYIYDQGKGRGNPDPEVEEIIAQERREKGIADREISEIEIINRYMAAMVNEAAKIVGEGIAQRPADVDVTLLNGYGFPRWRGGPMHYADAVGIQKILGDIYAFQEDDPYLWQPAPLLERLLREGRKFNDLNR